MAAIWGPLAGIPRFAARPHPERRPCKGLSEARHELYVEHVRATPAVSARWRLALRRTDQPRHTLVAVAPQVVVLDESKGHHHPIISVGGVVLAHPAVRDVEEHWETAKQRVGLRGEAIKYSMSWPDTARRADLIESIGDLSIQGVIAMLEDHRPKRMLLRKETRKELYVHRQCMEYVLQRIVGSLYVGDQGSPHFVVVDHRDDFPKLDATYRELYERGWSFASRSVLPSLRDRDSSRSLTAASGGPLVEIADMVVSTLTRWAACRCAEERGKQIGERDELDVACRAVMGLFPANPRSGGAQRRGYSIVTHTKDLTGKELLRDRIDPWINGLLVEPG